MTQQAISLFMASLGLLVSMAVLFLLWQMRKKGSGKEQSLEMHTMVSQQLQHLSREVNERLREHTHAVNESKDFLANRVSAAERTVRTVSAGLGKLEQATVMLQRTSEDIVSFQSMLKNPKIRGSFGEVLLTNLLSEVLPADRFDLQYPLKGGEIADAIIKLQDGYIVAVDAKFPLANYEAYSNEQDADVKARLRKDFIRDVKKHIGDISKKYIVPAERTLDYAFMYIPLEGVYYETMIQSADGDSSLWEYCLASHVIPTSPNSFLAYLQTVLVGLRGMKVEQQAREIMQHLGQLRRDFSVFSEEFSTVGKHLANAKNRFDDSARRLDKLGNRLEQIDTGTHTPVLPE